MSGWYTGTYRGNSLSDAIMMSAISIARIFRDWLWGYDYFISYGHADGDDYPLALKLRLENEGYSICLDSSEFYAGHSLSATTKRRIRASRYLLVVGRDYALRHSKWVHTEVNEYIASVGQSKSLGPIIINIDRSVETGLALEYPSPLLQQIDTNDWLRIDETTSGNLPNETIVNQHVLATLEHSFQGIKREKRRLQIQSIAIATLASLLVATLFLFLLAERRLNIANEFNDQLQKSIGISESRRMSLLSKLEAKRNVDVSMLLGVEAAISTGTLESIFSLLGSIGSKSNFSGFINNHRLESHDDQVTDIDLSDDGLQLATVSLDGKLTVYKVTDQLPWQNKNASEQDSEVPFDDRYPFTRKVKFSPNGTSITTCSNLRSLLWNAEDLSILKSNYLDTIKDCRSITFGDDETITLLNENSSIHVYNLEKDIGRTYQIRKPDQSQSDPVANIIFLKKPALYIALVGNKLCLVNLDAETVPYGCAEFSQENSPYIRDYKLSNKALHTLDNHSNLSKWIISENGIRRIKSTTIASETLTAAGLGSDGIFAITDSRKMILGDDTEVTNFNETVAEATSVEVLDHAGKLVVGTFNGSILLYDFFGKPNLFSTIYSGSANEKVHFSANGEHAIVLDRSKNTLKSISLDNSSETIATKIAIPQEPTEKYLFELLYAENDYAIVISGRNLYKVNLNTASIVELPPPGECLYKLPALHADSSRIVSNPTGSALLYTEGSNIYADGISAHIVNDGKCRQLFSEIVGDIAFHSNGEYYAVGLYGEFGMVTVPWARKNFANYISMGPEALYAVNELKFSSDGKYLALAPTSDSVRIYDLENKEFVGNIFHLEGDHIRSISFSHDSSLLAVGTDNTLELYRLDTGGNITYQMESVTRISINDMKFTDNNRYLLVSDRSGSIYRLDMNVDSLVDKACRMSARNLTGSERRQYGLPAQRESRCTENPLHDVHINALEIDALESLERFSENLATSIEVTSKLEDLTAGGIGNLNGQRADRLNAICWQGALCGFASNLQDYCEATGTAYPRDFMLKDTRGVVRAINGDYEGALLDFTFYISNAAGKKNFEKKVDLREQWIRNLRQNINPFADLVGIEACVENLK